MIWGYVRPQSAASASERPTAATNAPNADTGATETLHAPCGCDDHSLDRLRDMVRAGMGQMEASRAIWGQR